MRRLRLPVALVAAAAIAAACDNDRSPTAVPGAGIGLPAQSVTSSVCKTITFDDQGFSHASIVTSLTSGFGFNINVAVTNDPNGINTARTYDTDHVGGPDFDLEWNGASARCAACQGQDLILVIEGAPNFAVEGDSPDGGKISLTGFSGNGTFYVEEFKGFDRESSEGPIQLFVDGTLVGSSGVIGDGGVATIVTAPTTFTNSVDVVLQGSGGVDDIKICQLQEQGGGEGCTLGYWKQSQHFDSWVGYAPTDYYDVVFGVGPHITLLAALQSGGGGVYALLRHSTAALLNASSPDVDYDLSVAQVISLVQSAFASGNFESAKNTLASFNEQGCPLN
jgi:hypothetical protein